MTVAKLNGLYPPDFVAEGRQCFPVGSAPPGVAMPPRSVEIGDARALQATEGVSETEFFARHGFVLLPHTSAVRDWDGEVGTVYLPEVERVVRERLLPGRRVEVQQVPNVLRRGRGTPVPFYADGVHSDGGIGADDYAHNIGAFAMEQAAMWWRTRYDRDDVLGLIWIDFWRPTEMSGPLEHMPLALCDTASLDPADLVQTGMTGIAPEGRESHHLSLRHNDAQRWYYYPKMTVDELLVFKLGEFWKDPTPPRNCFHSAFHDPASPPDAELRQSCEHRVGVLVLRD
jgi:hypothetical protein